MFYANSNNTHFSILVHIYVNICIKVIFNTCVYFFYSFMLRNKSQNLLRVLFIASYLLGLINYLFLYRFFLLFLLFFLITCFRTNMCFFFIWYHFKLSGFSDIISRISYSILLHNNIRLHVFIKFLTINYLHVLVQASSMTWPLTRCKNVYFILIS